MKIRMLQNIAGYRHNGVVKGAIFEAVEDPCDPDPNSERSRMKRYRITNQERETSYVFQNEVEVIEP